MIRFLVTEHVEARLAQQEAVLELIVEKLEQKVEWSEWTQTERDVLRRALEPSRKNNFEAQKARTLEWHLFRGHVPEFAEPIGEVEDDLAERVRADLPGLVRLGAGSALKKSIKHVRTRLSL